MHLDLHLNQPPGAVIEQGAAPESAAAPAVIEVYTNDLDPAVPNEEERIKVIYIVPR